MTNWKQTQVQINSVDVSEKLVEWKYPKTFGDTISSIDLTFTDGVNGLLNLTNGQVIEVWEGYTTATDTKVFKGYVKKIEYEGNRTKVYGEDMLSMLKQKEITYSFDKDIAGDGGGHIGSIFYLLVSGGGLNVDMTTVQDTGAYTLNKYICDHADIFERCKKLADIMDWQFYYDASDDKVYFEPKGYTNNTTILYTGSNIVNAPKWTYDSTLLCNDVTVIGAEQLIESTYITSGIGGAGSVFTLPYKPSSVKVYVSNALKEGTVEGDNTSGTSYDYYVDYEKKRIRFTTSPGSSSAGVEIRYTRSVPTPVNAYDQASIDSYTRHVKTIYETDIRDITDAETRASNYIIKYSQPFISSELNVRNVSTSNLSVGQKVRVDDNVNDEDRYVVINKMTVQYPGKYDVLEVGDKTYRLADWGNKVIESVHRLEEEQSKNQSFLLHSVSSTGSLDFQRDSWYIWRQFINNSFILGHSTNGVLGSPAPSHIGSNIVLGDQRSASGLLASGVY